MRVSPVIALVLAAVCLTLAACQDDSARRQAATLSADEVAVTYSIGGRGPAVVLIHCWGGNRIFWAETTADLETDHRVIAVDLAGHGDSGRERADYTMEAFAGDVLAVMDAERVAEAVLVGHSMGGYVAMAAAQRAPDRVAGIVGIDNLHVIEMDYTDEQFDGFMAAMRADFPAVVTGMVQSMFPAGADPAEVQRALDSMAAMPPAIATSAFEHIFSFDLGAAAKAYARPLYLVNDDARPVDVDQWQDRGVAVTVIPMHEVGHFPMFTAAPAFRANVRQAIAAFASP